MYLNIVPMKFSDFPEVRRIREAQFGEFDLLRFANYVKDHKDLVWVAKNASGEVIGYIILYERGDGKSGDSDTWIYQLGVTEEITQDQIVLLINKGIEVLKKRGRQNIRTLVRNNSDPKIRDAFKEVGWKKIDTIWIMERPMEIPFDTSILKEINDTVQILEADPSKHLDQVVDVDRSAFIFGHRVPRKALAAHLARSGSFVAYEEETNQIVGYNYNTLNNKQLGHFIRLAVNPMFRRRRIATRLLITALNWFKLLEVQHIYLRTIPESAGSKLYEKHGFKHVDNESTYEFKL